MKRCFHYDFSDGKYKSCVEYIRPRVYRCKHCGMVLHTIDVVNLNVYVKSLNEGSVSDAHDIYEMLTPVPYVYRTCADPHTCDTCEYNCLNNKKHGWKEIVGENGSALKR